MPNHSPGKLVAVLKRLGLRDSIAAAYLSGLPGRPGQQPRITPAFTNAQRDIAKFLIVRRSHLFGWAPLPRGQETDHVLVRAGTGVILTGPGGKPVTAMGRIIYDTFDPVDVDDVRDFVTGNEGNRSWMYGDGRGFVTIGFGHLVENLGEAQGLNLANKDTGGAVFVTATRWPDLGVGALMAALALSSAFIILRQATREMRGRAEPLEHTRAEPFGHTNVTPAE